MLGLGFLRLNKILRKHKWKQREGDPNAGVDEKRNREDRSLAIWVLAIILVFAVILILELMRTSKLG